MIKRTINTGEKKLIANNVVNKVEKNFFSGNVFFYFVTFKLSLSSNVTNRVPCLIESVFFQCYNG